MPPNMALERTPAGGSAVSDSFVPVGRPSPLSLWSLGDES